MTTKKTTKTTNSGMKPKTEQGNLYNKLPETPNLQVASTHEVYHCINNRGEHYFAYSKTDLLKYLASINFTTLSILIEDVPLKFGY